MSTEVELVELETYVSTGVPESGLHESELPPVDGGRGAWLFLLSGFVMECTTWGYTSAFGVIEVYLDKHRPFDTAGVAAITSVGTINLALLFILPAGTVLLFRRFPHWASAILWTAMVVNCGSMLLSSWATEVWQLIVLQGFLGGLSGAILYTPVLIWLQDWFIEKRGMASGVIFAGTGVGGFVFPFLLGSLLQKIGFAWTVRVWSLLTAVAFTGCILTLRPRHPVLSKRPAKIPPLDFSWAKNPVVIMMCLVAFVTGISFYPVSIYLPSFTASLGSPIQTTVALAILNVSNTAGSLLSGALSDKVPYSYLMIGMGLISAIVAFLSWGFADDLGKTYAFALLFGLASGNTSLWNAVSRDVAGSNTQTSSLIFTAFCVARGIASVVGPLMASSLYNATDVLNSSSWGKFGYRDVIILVGSTALASAGGAAVMAGVKVKRQ